MTWSDFGTAYVLVIFATVVIGGFAFVIVQSPLFGLTILAWLVACAMIAYGLVRWRRA